MENQISNGGDVKGSAVNQDSFIKDRLRQIEDSTACIKSIQRVLDFFGECRCSSGTELEAQTLAESEYLIHGLTNAMALLAEYAGGQADLIRSRMEPEESATV